MSPTQIADQLGQTGLCVCADFLPPQPLRQIRSDFDKLKYDGKFQRASVGQKSKKQIHDEVRRDEIFWLQRESPSPAQRQLWGKVDLLQTALNRRLFLGLNDFEGHYACYPVGAFYQRHLDSLTHGNTRVISLVLYLNLGWKPEDGGCLRVYNQGTQIDIQPIGGTLVCFMSQELEHEVLISRAPRASFTGWYRSTKG
ncbi:MAG: 2OG-Fe(II) oxygenase [Bdellovibrio sp. CG10_big_fil_rev_8_21_14_0_10_47_8]|nr:MAG: 2OG-Fe(II) oxygenase [Bdellovibrio sp. CG10_big_fil_rev_8_21_14_0_10_47_8]